jgi:hypothetical protein
MINVPPPPPPRSIPLGPFRISSKICGDILKWTFIAGVNDTADKYFTDVNDSASNISLPTPENEK